MRVAVVGAGPVGCAAALRLARAGAEVVLVEPEDLPDLPDEEQTTWARPGAPHGRQAHNVMPLARRLLRAGLPDVSDRLPAAGVGEVDLAAALPDGAADPEREGDLVGLRCRRFLLERALRRAAEREPGVRRLPARALDLASGGLLTDRGPVAADLVVDASGRRSALVRSLVAAGAASWTAETCGVVYVNRYYRAPAGAQPTPLRGGLALRLDLPCATTALFRDDGDVFSVIFGVPPRDRVLRRALARPDGFDAAARLLPDVDRWVEDAVPVGAVTAMGGLANAVLELRRSPVPLVAVGDAAGTTDPQLGWGLSLGLLHVELLLDALAHGPDEGAGRARAAVQEDLQHRVAAAALEDRARTRWWDGGPWEPTVGARLWWAGQQDRVVAVAAARRTGALDLLGAFRADPLLRAAAEQAHRELLARGPADGPERAALLSAAAAPRAA